MTVFDRVKKLADKQKISIVELEEKLGFGRNSLYSWKKKTPNGESLNKVADYFDVSTDYLLGRTDNPSLANAIESLLHSNVSGDHIQSETGIGKNVISNYRTGKSKLGNMTLDTAYTLQEFAKKLEAKPMTDIKIKGIKKAVGEFNNWQGAARIYFDKSDLTVWTNVYGGPGEWDEYKEDSIVEVAQKATHVMAERDNTITMAQLKELCAGELNEQKNKPTS